MKPDDHPLRRRTRLRPAGNQPLRHQDRGPAADGRPAPTARSARRPKPSPKGQLPFIDDDGERVADSTFIRAHIERKYGFDFDAGLDARQRAEAWAIERMLENHFGWTCTYWRWLVPENFAKGPAHFFDQAPEPCATSSAPTSRPASPPACAPWASRGTRTMRSSRSACARSAALSLKLADNPYVMGAHALRPRCHRFRDARCDLHAVLRLAAAAAGRKLRQSARLHRPDDGGVLPRARLGLAAQKPSSASARRWRNSKRLVRLPPKPHSRPGGSP